MNFTRWIYLLQSFFYFLDWFVLLDVPSFFAEQALESRLLFGLILVLVWGAQFCIDVLLGGSLIVKEKGIELAFVFLLLGGHPVLVELKPIPLVVVDV